MLSAYFGSGLNSLNCAAAQESFQTLLAMPLGFTCLDFRLTLLWKTFKALSHRKRSCYGWSFTELNSWHELGQVCLYELQISMLLRKTIKLKQLVLGFVLV